LQDPQVGGAGRRDPPQRRRQDPPGAAAGGARNVMTTYSRPSRTLRAPTRTRPTVTSRVPDILEAVSPDSTVLSITQISRRTGRRRSTARRLVGQLTHGGALDRDGDGLYRIGLRLFEVAALAPRGPGLREAAMPFLEDLYEATHENVHLAVLDGLDVVYIELI